MTKYCLFLLPLAFAFAAFSAPKNCKNCGMVILHGNFYSPKKQQYVNIPTSYPDCRIFYRDSLVIEEMMGIDIHKQGMGKNMKEDRWTVLMGYLFIDLRTRSFYEYATMKDTAKVVKQYTLPDSTDVSSGWNFYYCRRKKMPDRAIELVDTVIDKISYKRVKYSFASAENEEQIGYFRCDKKGTMFQIEKIMGDSIGCPMTRCDLLSFRMNMEVEFVTDKLTPEQIKVFDTWEKYAKAHPVIK